MMSASGCVPTNMVPFRPWGLLALLVEAVWSMGLTADAQETTPKRVARETLTIVVFSVSNGERKKLHR